MELAISPEVYTLLKKANAKRFQILTDLFTGLSLNCDKTATLAFTPAVLIALKQVSPTCCRLNILKVQDMI